MNTDDDNQTVIPSTKAAITDLLPFIRRFADRLSNLDRRLVEHIDTKADDAPLVDRTLAQIARAAAHLAVDLEQVFLRRWHANAGKDIAPDIQPETPPASSALH